MLVMRPAKVTFGSSEWDGVVRVAIESSSEEMATAWDDEGPNLMFADSVRRKSSATVYREIQGDDLASPELGKKSTLVVDVDRGNDADGRRISMSCVVQSVSYSFSGGRSTRIIRLVAVSGAGDDDPVNVSGGV